jgi:hypothetical protein
MALLDKGAEIPPVAVWGNELKKAGYLVETVPISVLQTVNLIENLRGN